MQQQWSNCSAQDWVQPASPLNSVVMFSLGVLGNVVALVLLEVRRRKQSASLFQLLVTALVLTDLLGTVSLSPLVISAYSVNRSLQVLVADGRACHYFGFTMSFLSLATLAVLLSMAVERWLAIGHPYLYERRVSMRCGRALLPALYLVCALFCLLPFVDERFGRYVQYCPGTWCFVDLDSPEPGHKAFKYVYASCLLIMIACTVLCNISVGAHLLRMHRRRQAARGSVRRGHRSLSLSREVEHLLLLTFMTVAFVICSLPFVIRVYMTTERRDTDLKALLMLSVNPIIDPWVFNILSPPVPRLIWGKLCKASISTEGKTKTHIQSQSRPSNTSIELQK